MNRFFAIVSLLACGALVIAASGCRRARVLEPLPDMKLVAALRAGGGGSAEAVVAEATGTGWGTLKGRFLYAGDPPKLGFVSTGGKDGAVCGAQVPNQALVVDSATKGIANIVLYARKAPRVFKPEDGAAPAAAPQPIFDQKGCLFLSHVFGIEVKDTLEVKNSDPISHNTSISPPGNPSTNPLLPPNATSTYQFKRQLSAPAEVTCSIHPWMKAYIIARDDPYFAVTGLDGSFEIKNLPAGEDVEFQVWHEQATTGLEAKPGWSKGRFKVKVPADGVEDLQTIEVPATAFH